MEGREAAARQGPSHPQPRAGQLEGSRTAPALGMGTFLGLGMSHGPTGGLSLGGPKASWGRAVQAGDQPCCGIGGAGADGPRGLTWSQVTLRCGDALQARHTQLGCAMVLKMHGLCFKFSTAKAFDGGCVLSLFLERRFVHCVCLEWVFL